MNRSLDMLLVLDTNTLLRALANGDSPSAVIVRLCETRRLRLALSRAVVAEYRTVLNSPAVWQHHKQPPDAVELHLRRLRFLADYYPQPAAHFRFDRDPRDQKFLELAISAQATYLITHDLDLLSLTSDRSPQAVQFRRRLPSMQILRSAAFLRLLDTPHN